MKYLRYNIVSLAQLTTPRHLVKRSLSTGTTSRLSGWLVAWQALPSLSNSQVDPRTRCIDFRVCGIPQHEQHNHTNLIHCCASGSRREAANYKGVLITIQNHT